MMLLFGICVAVGSLIAGVVGYHLYNAKTAGDIGPIWPVFLATAGLAMVRRRQVLRRAGTRPS